ncbi:MAG TPA: hypothetical protein VD902_21805 [Symbiobacteriaceae bacterium]|nr:hypothetical protein [Symbiobacteriaceae bacterium]
MARRRVSGGVIGRRNEKPAQEIALAHIYEDLVLRGQLAHQVTVRQGATCCWPDCREAIVSYPHAVPQSAGGVHDVINRAGVCVIHRPLLQQGDTAESPARRYLQEYLQRHYLETCGLPPGVWALIAIGRPPVDLGVAACGRSAD